RAVGLGERRRQLLYRFEVEVVRRLVENEQVDAERLELGELRARPLSRGERRRRPVQMIGAEPELREERPRLFGGEAGARNELLEQTPTRDVGAAFLGEDPDTRPAADYSPPGRQQHVAEQSQEQRGLAAAVRSCDGEPPAGHEIERDRAEPEPPTLDDSVLEAHDEVPSSLTRGQRQAQLPRLERLLGHLVPLEQPL